MIERMQSFVEQADIITPNFTEAAYLLGEKFRQDIMIEEIKDWLIRLSAMGPEIVIITSVPDCRCAKIHV